MCITGAFWKLCKVYLLWCKQRIRNELYYIFKKLLTSMSFNFHGIKHVFWAETIRGTTWVDYRKCKQKPFNCLCNSNLSRKKQIRIRNQPWNLSKYKFQDEFKLKKRCVTMKNGPSWYSVHTCIFFQLFMSRKIAVEVLDDDLLCLIFIQSLICKNKHSYAYLLRNTLPNTKPTCAAMALVLRLLKNSRCNRLEDKKIFYL